MAYVGYVVNSHLCYDDVNEQIAGNWTFNGNNIYNGTANFNGAITVANTSTFNGAATFNYPVTFASSITATGTITSSNTNTWNGQQNVNGVIVSSGNNTWNGKNTFTQTVYGTAFTSLYGDIAEYYDFDFDNFNQRDYNLKKLKGYLVQVSSDKKVKVTSPNSRRCLGVISEKPALAMNDELSVSKKAVPVAYLGRVDCFIIGKVKEGQKLTTSKVPGVAKRKTFLDTLLGKPTVGYALDSKINDEIYQVEIVVK